jgi:uncharacterized protein (DUF1778 family)
MEIMLLASIMKRESAKITQLQLRVSLEEKAAIQRAARRAGMDMSEFVLSRVLPAHERKVHDLLRALRNDAARTFVLAELNDLLTRLAAEELRQAVAAAPPSLLSAELSNYWAAMVEHACAVRHLPPPPWTSAIPPLEKPMFGSSLESLRLHLLAHSPPAFRRRNIFIDTTIGGRV